MYRRALRIFETALEPDHPNLLTCRENYSSLQREASEQSSPAARI
jgi:hypothetical protein